MVRFDMQWCVAEERVGQIFSARSEVVRANAHGRSNIVSNVVATYGT